RTIQSLGVLFTKEHDYYSNFSGLMFSVPHFISMSSWSAADTEAFDQDIGKAETILKDALEEVDLLEREKGKSVVQSTPVRKGSDVFIVHGHDETNLYRL